MRLVSVGYAELLFRACLLEQRVYLSMSRKHGESTPFRITLTRGMVLVIDIPKVRYPFPTMCGRYEGTEFGMQVLCANSMCGDWRVQV
jgi:hypothetical protein